MKLLPIALTSVLLGAGLGVALAYVEVGQVESGLTPPPRASELAAGGSAGPDAPSVEGPEVEVDSALYNFGTMQRGSTESHEFTLTNTGTSPLKLEVGGTSCKCTLGEVAEKPLEPGQSTPVRLEWVAKSLPGPFRQVAKVLTNDPRQPTVELTVEGTITETAGLVPEEFLLGRMAADETAEATVYLASYYQGDDADPLVVDVAMDQDAPMADRYKFSVEPSPEGAPSIEGATSMVGVTVTAGPGLPIGNVTEWITMKTNLHDDKPVGDKADGTTLQVPLLAVVEGDISIRGAHWSKERGLLNLGKVPRQEGTTAKLLVSFKGEHAAEARAGVIAVDPEWLEVELGEPKEVREGVVHQQLTLRIPPGRPPEVRSGAGAESGGVGDGDARVRLSTNHPSTSELDMKVRFLIAD